MKKMRLAVSFFFAAVVCQSFAADVITAVVESGGDGAPGSHFTGQTFSGALGNGSTYTVPLFGVLAKTYSDRLHAYTNYAAASPIPSYLVGNPYIMTRNDNRENTGFRLDVTVSQDVLVYMLLDNRLSDGGNGNPPFNPTPITSWPSMTWMGTAGFRPVQSGQNRTANATLPDELGIDEGADGGINNWFSLYSNRYPAGTFSLFQQGLAGNNMYGVVIVGVGVVAPPPTPAGLTAVNGDTQVSLTWSAAATATGYNIKRSSTSGSGYTTVGSVAGTSFTDPGLVNGQDYFYVVSATNVVGESGNSAEAAGHPNPPVTGITATGGTNQIGLSWSTLGGVDSYSVLRAIAVGGPFTNITSGLAGTSYLDAGLPDGRTFYYRISASLGGAGLSGQSALVSATTAPSTPGSFTASGFGSTAIYLSWTATNPVLSQFILERSTDGVNFAPAASLAANVRNNVNGGLSLGTTYFYRIQATNAGGYSGYSVVASNTTPTVAGIHVNFGSGANNSGGSAISPIPAGYLGDIGDLFGDRTNGFFYGWTNAAGTNIVRDARYRQSAGSPDLRYDTFNHMQKSAGGAIWDIAVTNGFYRVRVVGGDPDNTDSTFQYDIEGNITATYSAANPFRWADFTTNVLVTDGRLTIANGPLAANNKLGFVDIFAEIPIAPVIGTQPQSQTNEEFRIVSLAVTLSQGSFPLSYQWFFNETPMDGATNGTLTFNRLNATNAGNYFVIITNYAGSVTSEVATMGVNPDLLPPTVVSVGSLDGNTVGITFSEEIDVNSGASQEASNYQIDGGNIAVTAISFRPDGKSVKLTLAQQITSTVSFDVLSIPDYAGNSDVSSTNITPMGFTAGDVGGPALAGSNYTSDNDTVEVIGGGADIWGTMDQGYLATKTVSGNFDARIKVNALRGSNAITKAVLVARETGSSNSAAIHVSLNPPAPGRDLIEMGLRPATDAATAGVGTTFTPANVPNGWMRIVRLGDQFTGYRSTNGVDWYVLGQTNVVFPAGMQIGFGITAHDNTLLATGTVSGFSVSQSFPDLAVTKVAAPEPVTVGGNVTYTITVTNMGLVSAPGTVLSDVLPAGLSFVSVNSSQGSSGNVGNNVTATLGTIPSLGSATVTIVATATNAGSITNTAAATTTGLDGNPGNNVATSVTTVNAGPAQQPIVNFAYTSGSGFSAAILTQNGVTYALQAKDDLNALSWQTLSTFLGDGTVKTFSDNPDPVLHPNRFYQIIIAP